MIAAHFKWTPRSDLGRFVEVKLAPAIRRGMTSICKQTVALAQHHCPWRSGELSESIQFVIIELAKTIRGVVFASAEHAGFVEFGTGIKGAGTYPGPLPQTGIPITGSWIYDYKKQNWIGMPAHPYLRPAYEEIRGEAKAIMRGDVMADLS